MRRSLRSLAVVVAPPTPGRPARRCFHSYEREPPPGPYGPIESQILSAATRHVPEYGFTETALVRGARDVRYLDASINLFPRGVFDLIHHYLVTRREALKDEVADQAGEGHESSNAGGYGNSQRNNVQQDRGPSEVRRALVRLARARLMANRPVIHRWHEVRTVSPASCRDLSSDQDPWTSVNEGMTAADTIHQSPRHWPSWLSQPMSAPRSPSWVDCRTRCGFWQVTRASIRAGIPSGLDWRPSMQAVVRLAPVRSSFVSRSVSQLVYVVPLSVWKSASSRQHSLTVTMIALSRTVHDQGSIPGLHRNRTISGASPA